MLNVVSSFACNVSFLWSLSYQTGSLVYLFFILTTEIACVLVGFPP